MGWMKRCFQPSFRSSRAGGPLRTVCYARAPRKELGRQGLFQLRKGSDMSRWGRFCGGCRVKTEAKFQSWQMAAFPGA